MKAVLLGVLLGLLVTVSPVGSVVAAVSGAFLVAVVSQPVCWAFAAGVVARPRLAERARRWAR